MVWSSSHPGQIEDLKASYAYHMEIAEGDQEDTIKDSRKPMQMSEMEMRNEVLLTNVIQVYKDRDQFNKLCQ